MRYDYKAYPFEDFAKHYCPFSKKCKSSPCGLCCTNSTNPTVQMEDPSKENYYEGECEIDSCPEKKRFSACDCDGEIDYRDISAKDMDEDYYIILKNYE